MKFYMDLSSPPPLPSLILFFIFIVVGKMFKLWMNLGRYLRTKENILHKKEKEKNRGGSFLVKERENKKKPLIPEIVEK